MTTLARGAGLTIIWLVAFVPCALGTQPYKIYSVSQYGTSQILCDRYVIQQGDHIWELLRRKGRIAEHDFPRFVAILKALNPTIEDVDRVYPGQEIVIPLRDLASKGKPADEGPQYVTVPIIPDVLYRTHEVRKGESLSRIVAAGLGMEWEEVSGDYLHALKRLNPAVEDLDLIYPGQTLYIPECGAEKGPRDRSAVPETAQVSETRDRTARPLEGIGSAVGPVSSATPLLNWKEPVSKAVAQLDMTLLAAGHCYFPAVEGRELILNLAEFPVIEIPDGRHLMLNTTGELSEDEEKVVRSYWDDLTILPAAPQAEDREVLDRVFRSLFGADAGTSLSLPLLDDGIAVTLRGDWIIPVSGTEERRPAYKCITLIRQPEERSSQRVVDYLSQKRIELVEILMAPASQEQMCETEVSDASACESFELEHAGREAFVVRLVNALDYVYDAGAPLSFDYSGVQISTRANIVHGAGVSDVVVDFGTFYGDAKSALESGGLGLVSIKADEPPLDIAKRLLEALSISYMERPVFFAANRNPANTTSLTLPGLLISRKESPKHILTEHELPSQICGFLKEKGIEIVNAKVVS